MTEFRAGDKVRLTGKSFERDYHEFQAGDIVTISRMDSDGSGIFDTPKGDYWYVYPEGRLGYHEDWGGVVVADETETTKPTVKRSDIAVMEEYEYAHGATFLTGITWLASLGGRLSTGESVSVNRHGTTAAEALSNLEAAIREQGWGIE